MRRPGVVMRIDPMIELPGALIYYRPSCKGRSYVKAVLVKQIVTANI